MTHNHNQKQNGNSADRQEINDFFNHYKLAKYVQFVSEDYDCLDDIRDMDRGPLSEMLDDLFDCGDASFDCKKLKRPQIKRFERAFDELRLGKYTTGDNKIREDMPHGDIMFAVEHENEKSSGGVVARLQRYFYVYKQDKAQLCLYNCGDIVDNQPVKDPFKVIWLGCCSPVTGNNEEEARPIMDGYPASAGIPEAIVFRDELHDEEYRIQTVTGFGATSGSLVAPLIDAMPTGPRAFFYKFLKAVKQVLNFKSSKLAIFNEAINELSNAERTFDGMLEWAYLQDITREERRILKRMSKTQKAFWCLVKETRTFLVRDQIDAAELCHHLQRQCHELKKSRYTSDTPAVLISAVFAKFDAFFDGPYNKSKLTKQEYSEELRKKWSALSGDVRDSEFIGKLTNMQRKWEKKAASAKAEQKKYMKLAQISVGMTIGLGLLGLITTVVIGVVIAPATPMLIAFGITAGYMAAGAGVAAYSFHQRTSCEKQAEIASRLAKLANVDSLRANVIQIGNAMSVLLDAREKLKTPIIGAKEYNKAQDLKHLQEAVNDAIPAIKNYSNECQNVIDQLRNVITST